MYDAFAASKFSAPTKALSARLVSRVQSPSWSAPAALVANFAFCVLLMRSHDSGSKLYARAALGCAIVNWLTLSCLANCVATVVSVSLTALDLLAANSLAFLCCACLANASELRRVITAALPVRTKRATVAPTPAVPEPAAKPPVAVPAAAAPVAAAPVAPAARISASGAPDPAKTSKPVTPLPGAPKTSPGAAARTK